MSKRICIPDNDPIKRFVLAQKGKNNLLVVGLNPSTANALKHDGTTNNIEKIALANGFDGWVLYNLSPQRSPYPYQLNTKPDKVLMKQNISTLNKYLKEESQTIKDIWMAWGNNIALKQFPYLKQSAREIIKSIERYNLNAWCIKLTDKGHPFHPSQQSVNRYIGPAENIKLKPFNVNAYVAIHLQ